MRDLAQTCQRRSRSSISTECASQIPTRHASRWPGDPNRRRRPVLPQPGLSLRGAGGARRRTDAIDAAWWKDEFGIPDDFVKQVGAMVQPGDSTIHALLRTANPDLVADQFRGYGRTILSTTPSRDQREKALGKRPARAL